MNLADQVAVHCCVLVLGRVTTDCGWVPVQVHSEPILSTLRPTTPSHSPPPLPRSGNGSILLLNHSNVSRPIFFRLLQHFDSILQHFDSRLETLCTLPTVNILCMFICCSCRTELRPKHWSEWSRTKRLR